MGVVIVIWLWVVGELSQISIRFVTKYCNKSLPYLLQIGNSDCRQSSLYLRQNRCFFVVNVC